MATKYILAGLSAVFAVMVATRLVRDQGRLHPQSRAWLIIAVVFALVSAWLFAEQ